MKPYFEDTKAGIVIYHGDCREIIPQLAKVDLVLTDPPYDKKTHTGARLGAQEIDFAWLSDVPALAGLLLSHSHRWVICFCALEMLETYKAAAGKAWIRAGIWDRITNMPQLTGDRPAQGGEGIAIMHPAGAKKWNGGGRAAIWRHAVERGRKLHPTQKPLTLFTELISQFSDAGNLILDPFVGSGTTLRAAKDLGRRAIGIDINERYCEVAASRLSQDVLDLEIKQADLLTQMEVA